MNVRPIQPSDTALYESILERTTSEDRYCRFFHVVDHFSEDEVHRFVDVGPDMIGFIAIGENGSSLGAAHASLLDAQTAELAIVVARDARRRGVGKALFGRLILELQARGYRHLVAYALAENHALTNLAKAVGMHSQGVEASVRTWSLDDAVVPSDHVPSPVSA